MMMITEETDSNHNFVNDDGPKNGHDTVDIFYDPKGMTYLDLMLMCKESPTSFFSQVWQLMKEVHETRKQVDYFQEEATKLRNYATALYIKYSKLSAKAANEDQKSKMEEEAMENSQQSTQTHNLAVASNQTTPGFTLRIEVVAMNGPSEFPVNQTLRFPMTTPTAPCPDSMCHILESPVQPEMESSSGSTISADDSRRSSRRNSHVKLLLDGNARVPERTNSPLLHPAQQHSTKYGMYNREIDTSDFPLLSDSEQRHKHFASEATLCSPGENYFNTYARPGISTSGIVRQCPNPPPQPKETKSNKQFHVKGILFRGGLSKSERDEQKAKTKKSRKSKATTKSSTLTKIGQNSYAYAASKLLDEEWSDADDQDSY